MAEIVGRNAELASVNRFLDAVGGRVLLIEGELGIGKTTLLDAARTDAVARGYEVLAAQPTESEAALGFATLADLLEPVDQRVLDELPAPQRRALDIALLREEPGDDPADSRAVAVAVLSLLRNLSARRPVLLVIDDLPWVDASSARVLSFMLRRIEREAVGLVGAVRTGWSEDPRPLLTDSVAKECVEQLVLGSLSVGAVRALIHARSSAALARSALLHVHDASGGNPYLALELASALADDAELPSVPPTLTRLVRDRIAGIPPATNDVLLLLSLAAEPTGSLAKRAFGDLVVDDLETAAMQGAIEFHGDRVSFAHPLIRSVVVEEASSLRRQAAHRRLASVAASSEERAHHHALVTEEPDEVVAAELDAAAQAAEARGASETAAALAELSVALTPPSDIDVLAARQVRAATYWFPSDAAKALAELESVMASSARGAPRAAALANLGPALRYAGAGPDRWGPLLLSALDEAGDDPAVAFALRHELSLIAFTAGDLAGAAEHGEHMRRLAAEARDPVLEAQSLLPQLLIPFAGGAGYERELVDRALAVPQPRDVPMDWRPGCTVAHMLAWSDELGEARALYDGEYALALERGRETDLPMLAAFYAMAEIRAGEWDHAEALVERGTDAAEAAASPPSQAFIKMASALVDGCRGRVEAARAHAGRAIELGHQLETMLIVLIATEVLGFVELSLGDPAAAHELLAPLAAMALAMRMPEPGMARFAPDEIEAQIRLGDLDGAEGLLVLLEERSAVMARPSLVAAAARCRALLASARGDSQTAEEAVAKAIATHDGLGMPFERARALLIAGEIRRRARQKSAAGAVLEEALAVFDALGAPLWWARANEELRRVGIRRAPEADDSQLTDAQRKVAELAAAGRTNREIAQALFMAERTVESHLTRAYRKLGVRSRTELARVIRPDAP